MTEENLPDKAGSRRRRRRRRRRPSQVPAAVPAANEDTSPSSAKESGEAPDSGAESVAEVPAAGKRRPRRDASHAPQDRAADMAARKTPVSGILEIKKDGNGFLRQFEHDLREHPADPAVPVAMVRKFGLRNGMLLAGNAWPGKGRQAPRLDFLESIDGMDVKERRRSAPFKKLTVIDPDFHYELGLANHDGALSMRILDLLAPLGRGQRGLLVAPPRTGKTTLLQNVARSMEDLYPDVHLMVLLIDERPEEATYWRRAITHGEVYVSTMDEQPKTHVRLAELVQFRAERLVEQGKEVMILLDSITRLTRAFNNTIGGKNSKIMSGGLDSAVFQKPKAFFGTARNTEDAGSLTILASALIDTGSRMDQVIYEEFKGTGNMEVTLDRGLADRRIYPALRIGETGTRKEEKLFTRQTMRKVNILRRVLSRLRPREAVEMLIDRVSLYPSNQEFLNAFSLDDVE